MLIIPELEVVVILVPRTGSGSLYRAVLRTYPKSVLLYRHMEADGVPFGYDRWEKLGVVRDPVDRMWSCYKFLRNFPYSPKHAPSYVDAMRKQAEVSFEDWLMHNDVPFNSGYERDFFGRYYPAYAVRHTLPENRKSQFIHLRPDLGTRLYRFRNLAPLCDRLGVQLDRENATYNVAPPPLSPDAKRYVNRVFAWDLVHCG